MIGGVDEIRGGSFDRYQLVPELLSTPLKDHLQFWNGWWIVGFPSAKSEAFQDPCGSLQKSCLVALGKRYNAASYGYYLAGCTGRSVSGRQWPLLVPSDPNWESQVTLLPQFPWTNFKNREAVHNKYSSIDFKDKWNSSAINFPDVLCCLFKGASTLNTQPAAHLPRPRKHGSNSSWPAIGAVKPLKMKRPPCGAYHHPRQVPFWAEKNVRFRWWLHMILIFKHMKIISVREG